MPMITCHRSMQPNGNPILIPSNKFAWDVIAKFPKNAEINVKITSRRHGKHHRKFFALLNLVFEAQNTYATDEGFLDAIKVAIGHCDERIAVTGTKFYVPRSISWASMDQLEFEEFYKKAVNVILTHILPMTNQADLEQQVFEILGEPTPAQLRR